VSATPDRWDAAAACIAVVSGALLAAALGQDAGFDVKNYHWYAGFQLTAGRLDVDVAPAQIQGYFNPLIHLPLWFGTHLLGPRGAAMVLGGLHGLGPWLVWMIVRRLGRGRSSVVVGGLAAAAAAVGFTGAIGLVSVGTSSGDSLMPVFVLGGLLLLLPAGPSPGRGAVLVSGALVGAAVGLKPTVAMYAIGVVAAMVLVPPWPGARRALVPWLLGAAAAFAVVAGPWMVNLWVRYENPVFPLLNHVFGSPWATDFSYSEDRLFPRTAREAWTFPLQFARGGTHGWEVPFRDARIAVLAVVGAAWAVGAARARGERPLSAGAAFLLAVMAVSYVVWQQASSVYRYLGVLELLAPAWVAVVVAGPNLRPARVAAAGAVLGGLFLWVQPPKLDRVPFAAGSDPWSVEFTEPPEAGSIVLIAGSDALAYLVPSMPQARVLRPWSSLSYHDDATETNALIRATLADHTGPVYLLEGPNPSVAREVVAYLGFVMGPCTGVATSVDPEVALCRLTRSRAAAY